MRRLFATATMAANNRRTRIRIDVQRENVSRRVTLSAKAQRRAIRDGPSEPELQFLRPVLGGRQARKALGNDELGVVEGASIAEAARVTVKEVNAVIVARKVRHRPSDIRARPPLRSHCAGRRRWRRLRGGLVRCRESITAAIVKCVECFPDEGAIGASRRHKVNLNGVFVDALRRGFGPKNIDRTVWKLSVLDNAIAWLQRLPDRQRKPWVCEHYHVQSKADDLRIE